MRFGDCWVLMRYIETRWELVEMMWCQCLDTQLNRIRVFTGSLDRMSITMCIGIGGYLEELISSWAAIRGIEIGRIVL